MYGIPKDIDLTDIISSAIQQICLSRYDVQFKFRSGRAIHVQGEIEILKHNTVIASWNENRQWSSTAFQKLFDLDVRRYSVPNNRTLEIQFEGNLILRLYDDSDQYERIEIYPEGIII